MLNVATIARAEILSPTTINGANPLATSNLGGTTNSTANSGSLTGLGQLGPTNFSVTANIVRATGASVAQWNGGMQFPNATTLQFQLRYAYFTNGATGPPAGDAGYATYNIQFNQAVNGLRFRWQGIDFGDNVEFFAFNGAAVVPIPASYYTLNGGEKTAYSPRVNRFNAASALDTNAVGIVAIDPTSAANSGNGVSTSVDFVFPANVAVSQIFVRSGKSNTSNGNVTTQLTNLAWNVDTTVLVSKTSVGGVGAFKFNGNNGFGAEETITTTVAGTAVSGISHIVTNANVATTITETIPAGYAVTAINCSGFATGTATPNLAAGSVLLDAAAMSPGNNVTCAFTNSKLPTITLSKRSLGNVGSFTFNGNNGFGAAQVITTVTQGASVSGTSRTLAAVGTATTITETIPSGYAVSNISCSGFSAGTATPNLAGGSVVLNAAAMAAGNDILCTFTNVLNVAAHSIAKTQSSGPNPVTAAGQTVGYGFTVTNTGNVPLTTVLIADQLLQGVTARTLTSGPTRTSGDTNSNNILDIGEAWVYAATYSVDQVAIDNGTSLSNTASVDTDQTTLLTSNAVVTPITQTRNLTVLKTGTPSGPLTAGQTVTYNFLVTNTGNTTISGVSINETSFNGTGGTGAITPVVTPSGASTTLAPGGTVNFTASYVVTQADVDLLQ